MQRSQPKLSQEKNVLTGLLQLWENSLMLWGQDLSAQKIQLVYLERFMSGCCSLQRLPATAAVTSFHVSHTKGQRNYLRS